MKEAEQLAFRTSHELLAKLNPDNKPMPINVLFGLEQAFELGWKSRGEKDLKIVDGYTGCRYCSTGETLVKAIREAE